MYKWMDDVAVSALGYRESLEATYDICRSTLNRGILGDFVECGVYAGAHCAVMAKAIVEWRRSNCDKEWDWKCVHLFDSFRGLPAATPNDEEIWAHHKAKTGEASCSLEDVQANMLRWRIPEDVLVYHPGWFEDTIPTAVLSETDPAKRINDGIAVLRLDADLYASTKVCMDYLYPLVNRGGWVIVDDWNLTGCRKAVQEVVIPAPICWRIPTK